MGLMIKTPSARAVRTFFREKTLGIVAKDAMSIEQAVKELDREFVGALMRQYDQIRDVKPALGGGGM